MLDINLAAAQQTVDMIIKDGGTAIALQVNVADEQQVADAVSEVERQFGGLDTLIPNAGVMLFGRDTIATELDLAIWQQSIDVNLTGMFLTCKHGLRALERNGGGAVVITGSPTGSLGCAPTFTAYSTNHRRVILASSLGTVFEWYDFYLYGALSVIISKQFFSGVNETTGFVFALLAFAAGFFVRPFGALVFGRLGDLVGRKHTFLITIVIMGASTALVGLLPSYASIGVAAPVILILLRLLQGLALGGEYGGAATYVAEHAPAGKRGFYTSWIQTTATMGLFLSLLVILTCRIALGDAFETWGWRIPFLLSIVLLAVSVYIRLQLHESPAFLEIKNEGKLSKAPLTEAFGQWSNLKIVILALFGATAGQAVVWYGGQFYALFFIEKILQVDSKAANLIIAAALLIATPFFVVWGAVSDKIGRKRVVLAGCLLAALTYFPAFKGITHFANPALEAAVASAPVTILADPQDCSFQFDPVGKKAFANSCDVAKSSLAKAGIPYENEAAPAGAIARVRIGTDEHAMFVDSFLRHRSCDRQYL